MSGTGQFTATLWGAVCRYAPFFVLIFSTLLFLISHHTGFLNSYIINDDTRQQLYWMQRWLDPALYPESILNEYAMRYVPWGVQSLYFVAATVVSPLLFSKLLTGVLFVLMAMFAYWVGKSMADEALGLSMVAVYWAMPIFLHSISGGLSRAFAGPLMLLFILAWVRRVRWLMAGALLLQAFFIPYIFILCGGSIGLAMIAWRFELTSPPPFLVKWSDYVISALACCGLLAWRSQMHQAGFGPMASMADMTGRPEFSEAGRFGILPVPSLFWELFVRPFEYIAPFRDGGPVVGGIGVAVCVGLLFFGIRGFQWKSVKSSAVVWLSIGSASFALYILARLILLQLFIPSRYLEYTMNILYCCLLGCALVGVCRYFRLKRETFMVGVLVTGFVIGCVRLQGVALYDYTHDRPVCEFVRSTTDKDVLVAGHPYQMDNLLTFGQRNVFVSYELAHPWCVGYWKVIQPRLEDLFKAYYSSDLLEIIGFCQRNSVDYLVVDEQFFEDEFIAGGAFFAPFDDEIRALAAHGDGFAVLDADLPGVIIGPGVKVLDVKKMAANISGSPE